MSLFNELKRRNVFRVGIAYIIIAWLLMQVGDTLGPALLLPDWINSALAFFLILGFPLAIFFAWAFELTPEGLKKEKEVSRSESTTQVTRRKLDYAIIGLLAVALVYFVWESRFQADVGDSVEVVATDQATNADADGETEPEISRLSIAVLPFDNRSSREEDQFFTDGIHDDLLTTIAKIGSMKVISRTSVMEYRETVKKIPQIAKELGVANILEGGIQRSGNQVRINVQLIDAATDEHLWAEIYDRELTAENLFSIQSEISKAIADALQATLTPVEEQRIDAMPTNSLVAFDAYQHGRQLMATRDGEKLKLAVEEFNKAVELDPEFALAWVGVADSNAHYSFYGTRDIDGAFPIREEAINRALEIDGRLGEAYASLGLLRNQQGEDEKAEAAFRQAIQLSPNYATAWQWYSQFVAKSPRQRDQSIELLSKAAELDPRSEIIAMNLANSYRFKGLYSIAERQLLKLIEVHPEFALAHRTLAAFYLMELGRYDQALFHTLNIEKLDPGKPMGLVSQLGIYLEVGDLESAEKIHESFADTDYDDYRLGFADIWMNLYKNNPAGVREAINWLLPKVTGSPRHTYYVGYYELILGDSTRARELYLAADPRWLDPGQWSNINNLQEDGCIVSWILIHTGDVDLGQRLLIQTTANFDETLRSVTEHTDNQKPETCYLTAGDTEKALQSIETQLAHNHLYDWKIHHQLPMYDLIRDEPRYQAALEGRERKMAVQRDLIAKMDLGSE